MGRRVVARILNWAVIWKELLRSGGVLAPRQLRRSFLAYGEG